MTRTISTTEVAFLQSCLTSPFTAVRNAALDELCAIEKSEQLAQTILDIMTLGAEPSFLIKALKAYAFHGVLNQATQVCLYDFATDYRRFGEVSLEALKTMGTLGYAQMTVASLSIALCGAMTKNLSGEQTSVEAIRLLQDLDQARALTVPFLVQCLFCEGEHDKVSKVALRSLVDMELPNEVIVPLVCKAAAHKSPKVAFSAWGALSRIEIGASNLADLLRLLEWKNEDTGFVQNRYICLPFAFGIDLHELVVEKIASLETLPSEAVTALKELRTRSLDHPQNHVRKEETHNPRVGRRPKINPTPTPLGPSRFTSKKAKEAAEKLLAKTAVPA